MLDRRDFLKLGGGTAFAALFGGWAKIPTKHNPFLIPPGITARFRVRWPAVPGGVRHRGPGFRGAREEDRGEPAPPGQPRETVRAGTGRPPGALPSRADRAAACAF